MQINEHQILITGGAGYIGSHTIIALCEAGFRNLVSVDNYSNSSDSTYARIKYITGIEIVHRQCDLSDSLQVENLFKEFPGITGVIHFAAHKSVPESVANPIEYYRNNINSLINVLKFGSEQKLRSIIFSSSCSVYGNINSLPVNEETPAGQTESPYAYSKVIGERILNDFTIANSNISGISLRYFNPVGAHESGMIGELPDQRPNNLVPVITQTAIGKLQEFSVFGNDYPTRDGTCIRDYIHVCDIAEAHVSALKLLLGNKTLLRYDVMNLGSGNGVTVLEAIQAFEKASGIRPAYKIAGRRAGDVVAIFSDSAKANRILGWSAQRSLDVMMSSAWKWELYCKENGI
jgi:UDP-glucose 4-epimerase